MNKAIWLSATGSRGRCRNAGFRLRRRQPAGRHRRRRAAGGAVASADSTVDRVEVENIVRDYLLKNPELLLEMQHALEAKQKEEQRIANLEVIKNAKDEIFNAAYDGIVGNPNGKVTIVEFYDYNCGYCKRATGRHAGADRSRSGPALRAQGIPDPRPGFAEGACRFDGLPHADAGKIRRIPQPAARRPGPRQRSQRPSRSRLSLGADEAKLREEMKNPAINEAFAKTYDLANKLAITGTPPMSSATKSCSARSAQEVLAEKIAAAEGRARSRLPTRSCVDRLAKPGCGQQKKPLRSFRGGLCQL